MVFSDSLAEIVVLVLKLISIPRNPSKHCGRIATEVSVLSDVGEKIEKKPVIKLCRNLELSRDFSNKFSLP